MAKPIQATPTLYGEDANRFLRNMIHEENRHLTNRDKEIIKGVREISKIEVSREMRTRFLD